MRVRVHGSVRKDYGWVDGVESQAAGNDRRRTALKRRELSIAINRDSSSKEVTESAVRHENLFPIFYFLLLIV